MGEYGNGGSKSTGRWEYVWLPTEDGQAIPVGVYKGGQIYALHTDHLGTPRRATNEAGSLVWQWPISGFGENKPSGYLKATQSSRQALTNDPVLLRATSPSLELNLRYPGQYFDEETGLHYNLHRSYMPGQGRYSQSDPIGLNGGSNRFGYANQSPIASSDPNGLSVLPFIRPLIPLIPAGCMLSPGCRDLFGPMWIKPPDNAHDPNGPKAPGKPGEAEGFKDPKGGEKWVRNPNGRGYGWQESDGGVWCPTGPDSGSTGDAHGGPHWDVQYPGGRYDNVYPGGRRR